MRVTIRHVGGNRDGQVQQFTDKERIAIGAEGSSEDVGFPVSESSASGTDEGQQQLAEICFDGVCYLIENRRTGAHTRVNGQTVESVSLSNGDVIDFGEGGPKLEFHYELDIPDSVLVEKGVKARWRDRFARLRILMILAFVGMSLLIGFLYLRSTRNEAELKELLEKKDLERAESIERHVLRFDETFAELQKRFETSNDLREKMLAESRATQERVERLRGSILDESRTMLESRMAMLEQARKESKTEVVLNLKREIDGLRSELGSNATITERFQRILDENDRSVLFIYVEYDYKMFTPAGEREGTASGWGSGFFVSAKGEIVTNKHVIKPWLFDAKLAALSENGLATVDPGSVRISVWPGGTKAFESDSEYDYSRGWNTHRLKNLTIVRTALDTFDHQEIRLAGGVVVSARVHRHDNNDLAILQATGGTIRPVAMKRLEEFPQVRKLDPVMVIGFPLGRQSLETLIAESSPSTGTIRKIEDTIYVTASIIPGNSGGPVFTADGEVIGVATRVYSETLGVCLRIEHALGLLNR